MPRLAQGERDARGVWHAANPADYPPMDVHGTLPWSVLRQDASNWQARKRWWIDTHDLGRPTGREHAAGMMSTGRHGQISGGVSVYDPYLAELLLTWMCPPGGTVLDPCAGGPERAVVATSLGYGYIGVEPLPPSRRPGEWITGYAQHVLPEIPDNSVDMVLACPPYHNRERYSDDPRDLSAMTWTDYLSALATIITQTARTLRPDRFACWTISDVRDSRGHLRMLPSRLAGMLTDAGMHITNELILVAPAGIAAKRMRPPWQQCRTTTRRHQIVYTAVKGDRRNATAAIRGSACST